MAARRARHSHKDGLNSADKMAARLRTRQMSKEMTTQIYAAMAIALHRACGFDADEINAVFAVSQDVWIDFAENKRTVSQMEDLCFEETGIRLVHSDPYEQGG